jgi:pimeloyl-ACP methyl ester carboxylesterase
MSFSSLVVSQGSSCLLRQLGISKAHLLGHSFGGRNAINFTLTYPDSVRSLGLAASSLDGREWAAQSDTEAIQAVKSMYQAGKIISALELLLDYRLFKPATDNPDIRFHITQIWAEYSGWEFTHTDPVIPSEPPAAQRLDEIEVPTLVIIGALDAPGFIDIANYLESNIKDARKVVLTGVGHMLNMETPERFNDSVFSFLAKV